MYLFVSGMTDQELLRTIIELKNYDIQLLQSFITWGIGIVSVAVVIIISFIEVRNRRATKFIKRAKEITEELEEKQKTILENQNSLDEVLSDDKYINRIKYLEKKIDKLESSVSKWEEEELRKEIEDERRNHRVTIEIMKEHINHFDYNEYNKRFNDDELKFYFDVKKDIQSSVIQNKNIDELEDKLKRIKFLYKKYYRKDDNHSFIV
ncbi:hypothetical protein [Salibacterium aidingense]|uniref:hypothetical protein n=1 Tax=Salibacterium aidingense TaxID=384933 RepID=UPI003BEE7112